MCRRGLAVSDEARLPQPQNQFGPRMIQTHDGNYQFMDLYGATWRLVVTADPALPFTIMKVACAPDNREFDEHPLWR